MSGPKSERRTARSLLVALSILLLVVVAERWRWFARLESAAQPELTWIWAPVSPDEVKARAFYAVRDFALAAAPTKARLEVLGDPEYIVDLNGTRVGSGSYRADAPLDDYEVGDLLVAGSNRVVLELRSPIGSGGATLRIAAEGRTLVATGGDWSIQETTWQGAFSRGPLSRSSIAEVLGVSPFGRWGTPGSVAVKPRFGDQVARRHPVAAHFARLPYSNGKWRRLPPRVNGSRKLGAAVEFDFGAERSGYIYLGFDRGQARTALLRAAPEPAAASGWLPDAIVLTVNGAGRWLDVVPRRFRYVEVVGLRGLRWAGVFPLRPGQEVRPVRPLALRGLFNLRVDPQRWPAVDEIWKTYLDKPRAAPVAPPARRVRRAAGARTPEQSGAPAGRHRRERR